MKKFIPLVLSTALLGAAFSFSGCGQTDDSNTLTLFNYGDYIDYDLITQFEAETGIDVKYEEAATPEELYTKFCSGAVDYDLLCTSEYMIARMIKEDRLSTIDFSALPNASNIGQTYWDYAAQFDSQNQYAMPYFLGTVGILYNTSKVDEEITSWKVLYEQPYQEKYKNQMILINSQRDAYMITLKYLGYSLNSNDRAQLKAAQDLLLAQKEYAQAYLVDESRDEMISGNAAMAVIYSGDAITAQEYNPDLKYVIPEEGTNLWIDSWVMPKDCQHKETALQFLDFICRQDVALQNFEYVWYTSPNTAVQEYLAEHEPETLQNTTIFPTAEMTKNCEVSTQIDPEMIQLYTNYWKQLKSH